MALLPDIFPNIGGFDWDKGNSDKNQVSHGVSRAESEQVFLNRPLVVSPSLQAKAREPRYLALGRADTGRRLAVVFTIRGRLIRVISCRDMSRRERKAYAAIQEA